jgi:hypothetical protein
MVKVYHTDRQYFHLTFVSVTTLTVNSLESFLYCYKLNSVEAMNILQDEGIISDLCATPADVAEADIPKAIAFLKDNEVLLF